MANLFQFPQLSLTEMMPTNVRIPEGYLFVVLKSYFDGGNQADSREYDVVSLAVVSGTQTEWKPFECDWKRNLKKHKARHLHTTDAVSLQGIYKGWTKNQRDAFLKDCVKVASKHHARINIGNVPGKFGLYCFVISFVLKDFVENIKRNPDAPNNASEGCLRQALGDVLIWSEEQAACEYCQFFFDQGEPFYGHLHQILQSKKALKDAHLLKKIIPSGEANMRHTPPLQLADLYAWSVSHRLVENKPKWQLKLLNTHYRWEWIDKDNIHNVNHAHQAAFHTWKIPKRAATK